MLLTIRLSFLSLLAGVLSASATLRLKYKCSLGCGSQSPRNRMLFCRTIVLFFVFLMVAKLPRSAVAQELSQEVIRSSSKTEQLIVVTLGKDQKVAVYALNRNDGSLILRSTTDAEGGPGAMCLSADGRHLYVAMKQAGAIAAYRIDDDASLSALGESVVGAGAAYLSIHPSGKYLASAYYQAGRIAIHKIGDDGKLGAEPLQVVETDERAHAIVWDRSGKFVFVPHTRPNAIFQFRFDAATGKLTPNDPAKLLREGSAGPRHLWFDPIRDQAYGSDEKGSSISSYVFDKKVGTLAKRQTLTSLSADGHEGRKSTSDIEVHPSGKFVYIANRGYNAIASFKIGGDGSMSSLQHTPTEAVTRSFNISNDGRFLIAAGQTSGNLTVFRIDPDGRLERLSTTEAGISAWWVQMIERPRSK